MSISKKVKEFLDEKRIPYSVMFHKEAFTAQEVAATEHISGYKFAKVVILKSGKKYFMAVVPAPYYVDLKKFQKKLGLKELTLASEDELDKLFPDCDTGAEPPFGNLYNLPVYIDPSIAKNEEIVFNAGYHNETITIKTKDYLKYVKPEKFSFKKKVD